MAADGEGVGQDRAVPGPGTPDRSSSRFRPLRVGPQEKGTSRPCRLTLCEWIVTHTERGRAALTCHGIAAQTFLRVCATHAESTTGRHVSVCLDIIYVYEP